MKTIFLLGLLCATAYAFPASVFEDESDERFLFGKGGASAVEIDVGESDEDSFFPKIFRPMFMRPFPSFKFMMPNFFSDSFFGFDNIFSRIPNDAQVTNSSSTTKVVDGQRITINSTTYKNQKDGSIYQYEVIKVSNAGESAEGFPDGIDSFEIGTKNLDIPEQTTIQGDSDSLDNEIRKEEFANYDVFGGGFGSTGGAPYQYRDRLNNDYIDLSGDIYVNKLAEQSALQSGSYTLPPDVEVFPTHGTPAPLGYYSAPDYQYRPNSATPYYTSTYDAPYRYSSNSYRPYSNQYYDYTAQPYSEYNYPRNYQKYRY